MKPMKSNIAVVFALVLLLSAACSKGKPDGSLLPSGERMSVVFDAGSRTTKASVSSHEDNVASLDLLVFRTDDRRIDAYNRVTGTTRITASVTANRPLHWYVVANAPQDVLSAFADEASFLSSVTLLSESTDTTLVMHASGTMTATPSMGTVSVSLLRYASKVSVRSLEVEYLNDFSVAPSVSIGTIALINAVGSVPWSGTATVGTVWYNRLAVDNFLSAGLKDLLVVDDGFPAVTSSAPVNCNAVMYAMPNPVNNGIDSSTAPAWSPRNTRIAVELIIDGVPNWYRVTLPAMTGNTHYVVDRLTVVGPGASSPDLPEDRTGVEFDIRIAEWTENTTDISFEY